MCERMASPTACCRKWNTCLDGFISLLCSIVCAWLYKSFAFSIPWMKCRALTSCYTLFCLWYIHSIKTVYTWTLLALKLGTEVRFYSHNTKRRLGGLVFIVWCEYMEYSSNGKKDTLLRRNFALKIALMTDINGTHMGWFACAILSPCTASNLHQYYSG